MAQIYSQTGQRQPAVMSNSALSSQANIAKPPQIGGGMGQRLQSSAQETAPPSFGGGNQMMTASSGEMPAMNFASSAGQMNSPAVMPPSNAGLQNQNNTGAFDAPPPTIGGGMAQPSSTLATALQQAPGGQFGSIGQTRYGQPTSEQMNNSGLSGWRSSSSVGGSGGSAPNQNATQWNSNFAPVDTGTENFRQFGDQMYNHSMSRLQPQLEQQEQGLRQSLVDRGLQPGTEAYNAEFNRMDNARNDMMSATALGAEQLGLQAQNQYFGQQSQNNQFGLAQNQQNYGQQFGYDQLANALAQARIGAQASTASANASANASMHNAGLANQLGYSQLNEGGRQFDIGNIFNTNGQNQNFMLGLLGANNASQNTGINQFNSQQGANNNWWNQISGATSNAPGVSFTPNTGYTNSQIQGNQNYMNAIGADTSAATGLLGGAMMMSDERVKENIEFVETVNGVNVYDFDYIDKSNGDGRYRGVMAQEVMETHPDAVVDIAGVYHVDYNKLPVDMVRL